MAAKEIRKSPLILAPLVPWVERGAMNTVFLNPLTPMSNRIKISPYNINQISDENKEKYQFEDNKLIQY